MVTTRWCVLMVFGGLAFGCSSSSINRFEEEPDAGASDAESGGAAGNAAGSGTGGASGAGAGGTGSGGTGSGGAGSGGVAGGAGVAGSAGAGGCQCMPSHAFGTCVDGGCQVVGCLDGYLDCNGDPADGCEVDPKSNVDNCGKCGTNCTVAVNGSPVCVDGVCEAQCDPGYLECDGDPSNGCEASKVVFEDTDKDNYGVASVWKEACATSPGWAAQIGDCDDQDPKVHPGAGFYTTPNAKVGFDYNCDGVTTKQNTTYGSCSSSCKFGWLSTIPNCGSSATYVNSCSTTCGTATWTQSCN